MINLKTKAEGMIYSKNGIDYTIYHDYFKVLEFKENEEENKVKIHIQNSKYDIVIYPYIDPKEDLKIGSTIKIAYILEGDSIICHGYEVVDIVIPELDSGKLAPHKILLDNNDLDISKYKNTLDYLINMIKSDDLRNFVIQIIKVNNGNRFFKWSAATNVHHNYPGGLLQHTVNVAKTAYNIAINYKNIDLDIILSGALLHDIGKLYEYEEDGSISTEGKLFDHINIGTRMLFEEYYHPRIDGYYKFPERDLQHLAHIILSHHGKQEWGSPRTPATQEALIVHLADYIDTNMFIMNRELYPLSLGQSVKSKYIGQIVQTKLDFLIKYDN